MNVLDRRGSSEQCGLRVLCSVVALAACSAPRPPVAEAAPRPEPSKSITDSGTGLTIPKAHPRLWWTPERLARGRQWARKNGHALDVKDDAESGMGHALRYILSGDTDAGRFAVKWLMGFTFETSGVASDHARWYGEDAVLVFDWCYDLMTPTQRQTIIARWNGYLKTLNEKSWGGVGMESNNYYWGYLRNDLEWGIATYHENPQAPGLLDQAINTRYRKSFLPFATGAGRGGVLPEGTQYGPYIPEYATTAFTAAADYGVDLWKATKFFKEATYYIIYATTPSPTVNGDHKAFELLPFNDDEKFVNGGGGEQPALGMYMRASAERWRGSAVGQHAQAWLNMIDAKLPPQVLAGSPGPAQPKALSTLPLDYYSPGIQYLYARSAWGPQASLLHLQMGAPIGVGHQHIDWGNFQMWRHGRWLTRETTGYGELIANWGGGRPLGGAAPISCESAIGHNVLLFEGAGPRDAGDRRGVPRTTRLESRADYVYAAVDLGDSYRCTPDAKVERDDNPYAGRVVREFVFVRALEALVIFDRVESTSEKKPANQVVKTFVLHTESKPTFDGNRWLATMGDQSLRVWTLLPTRATPRVVAEGSPIGQNRVEIDTQGGAQSYFLHVLQGRDAHDPDLVVSFQQDDKSVTVSLKHPTRGNAQLLLEKGASAGHERFGFSRSADALVPKALSEQVQSIEVTDEGPVWGP